MDFDEATSAVIESLKRLKEGIDHHEKTAGEDILMVEPSRSGPVFTFQGDHRIYLTSQVNDRASGAFFFRVITHETSHSYNKTHDIWPFKSQQMASTGLKDYQAIERQEAAKIAKNPLFSGKQARCRIVDRSDRRHGSCREHSGQGGRPGTFGKFEKIWLQIFLANKS